MNIKAYMAAERRATVRKFRSNRRIRNAIFLYLSYLGGTILKPIQEVKVMLNKCRRAGTNSDIFQHFRVHQIFSQEYVEEVATVLKSLKAQNLHEVCAGDGMLSLHLQRMGIAIKPSDLEAINSHVRKADFRKMLKENPDVVLGVWLPVSGSEMLFRREGLKEKEIEECIMDVTILKHPSVKYLVTIGDAWKLGNTSTEDIWDYPHVSYSSPSLIGTANIKITLNIFWKEGTPPPPPQPHLTRIKEEN